MPSNPHMQTPMKCFEIQVWKSPHRLQHQTDYFCCCFQTFKFMTIFLLHEPQGSTLTAPQPRQTFLSSVALMGKTCSNTSRMCNEFSLKWDTLLWVTAALRISTMKAHIQSLYGTVQWEAEKSKVHHLNLEQASSLPQLTCKMFFFYMSMSPLVDYFKSSKWEAKVSIQ